MFDVKHAKGPGYDCVADCWSLGVTLYVLLSGTHPFTPNYSTEDEKIMRLKMRRYKSTGIVFVVLNLSPRHCITATPSSTFETDLIFPLLRALTPQTPLS